MIKGGNLLWFILKSHNFLKKLGYLARPKWDKRTGQKWEEEEEVCGEGGVVIPF